MNRFLTYLGVLCMALVIDGSAQEQTTPNAHQAIQISQEELAKSWVLCGTVIATKVVPRSLPQGGFAQPLGPVPLACG